MNYLKEWMKTTFWTGVASLALVGVVSLIVLGWGVVLAFTGVLLLVSAGTTVLFPSEK